jgi:cyclic-di-AMP phosphodiesterase PgpH
LLMPLFEQFFHLTTDMTLMELADMNHPLLKRMAIQAPGTYNHSIMVANLAEAAAESIGADGLLCRVVSYYHDIGKLKKPQNFIENQHYKKNVHDRISPSMSVRIITGHVREGLELAEEYQLPQAIKDIIPQHHGDAPIAFFYHKACEEKGETEIDIRDFSYGGPRPQTRENAIIMIADSVEAASRTMKSTTIKDIRAMVKKIISGKIAHDQLDECGLDLNDLSEMVNGMMPILEGVFHSRIEYPEEEEKDNGEV